MRFLFFALFYVAMFPLMSADLDRPEKPNIVILLADDLGWQDVKCYDIDEPSPMETPNLDALAGKGVKFLQAYSPAPVCAPSRAAILSGHHPVRGEMTSVAGGFPPHARHPTRTAMFSPWYSSRIPTRTLTLAEALKSEGYATGHSGKWHVSKNHYAWPNPFFHGFDYSVHDRGVQVNMKPDRLTGFATANQKDPYQLDENGFPYDAPQHGALDFIKANQDQPFFLYYATWLVHAPIVMRSEVLLRKYEKKLGVKLTEEHKTGWSQSGQTNPFYCAMVEQFDYFMGQIIDYLQSTEDPRWPGHKLSENTYIIFTSDNGGMEGGGKEIYTDNYPLDRGKISVKEGGIRVPLIITGPGIPAGVETDVMANGLDFFPTILSLTGTAPPEDKIFDGCDLTALLQDDPTDPSLVRDSQGEIRDTMFWHFPQAENTSTIRRGDHKLVRRYSEKGNSLELYQLYRSDPQAGPLRMDIEEAENIAGDLPGLVKSLDSSLTDKITSLGGRTPYFNPNYFVDLRHKEKVPDNISGLQVDSNVEIGYQENGSKVVHVDLIYAVKGGGKDEEWLRISAQQEGQGSAWCELPIEATHYFINLIDENNFLVSHPEIDAVKMKSQQLPFSSFAIAVNHPAPKQGKPIDLSERFSEHLSRPNTRVLWRDDFEVTAEQSVDTTVAGVSISNDHSAAGQLSLQLFEAKDLARDWMPMVEKKLEFPVEISEGKFTISCDVRLDRNTPGKLSLMMRDHSAVNQRVANFGSIVVGDGALKVNGQMIIPVDPGFWYHLDLSMDIGVRGNRMISVSATTQDGRTASRQIPNESPTFSRPDWIGFAGIGELGSKLSIDNVVLSVED